MGTLIVQPDVCGKHRQRVGENKIIFHRLVMHVIAAHAEIERAFEIGCQPEFLAQLPGVLLRNILRDEPVAATKLRIAEVIVPSVLPIE